MSTYGELRVGDRLVNLNGFTKDERAAVINCLNSNSKIHVVCDKQCYFAIVEHDSAPTQWLVVAREQYATPMGNTHGFTGAYSRILEEAISQAVRR